ncbi:unnamed protein product [Leuciscus chuanchicus]
MCKDVPGVLGMNILGRCYQDLFGQHGTALFELPVVAQSPSVLQALQHCQQVSTKSCSDLAGNVRVRGHRACRIPGGTMKLVTATCSSQYSGSTVLFEPPESGLPAGLLASPALVRVTHGTVWVPIVNVGTVDVVLYPTTVIGSLREAYVISLPTGVVEVDPVVATVQSLSLETASPLAQQIESVDWSVLSKEEQVQVRTLLQKYQVVFSAHERDLGCTRLISHDIPLLDDTPVRQRYRRIPPSDYEVVKTHINQLLETQVIRESSSPYASPIVLVKKKERKDQEGCIPIAAYRGVFGFVDRGSVVFNIRSCQMPFGLCNAPSTFQRLMERMFGDQQRQSLLLYLDDIIVYSSSIAQHLERLEVVLDRLRQEGLKARLEKCAFFRQEVRYLGHIISAEGVATDPSKIEAVAQWRCPTSVSELRTFWGFASYYRRFVEGFAKLASPLHKLVAEVTSGKSGRRKGQSLAQVWTDQCQEAFEGLKSKLTMAPVLAYADFSRPFILEVDASYGGLGAVLSQEHQGKVRPIAYASRSLRPTERNMSNYSSMKLEFLALKWAMAEKFREYLLGHKCLVYTDNNPLSHLATAKLGATEQRWAAELAAFDFEVRYRSGKSNRNADALSRQDPTAGGIPEGLVGGSAVPVSLHQAISMGRVAQAVVSTMSVLPGYSVLDICSLQEADPVIGVVGQFWEQGKRPGPEERKKLTKPVLTLLQQWDRLVLKEGVLYRMISRPDGGEDVFQMVLPDVLRREVLTQLHQQHGHQGIERTGELIRQRCFWPGMSADITRWCQECDRCELAKDIRPAARGFMGHLLSSRPNEILAVDFTVLEPSSSGQENVLVMTDVFSKFTMAVPTRDQRAETVARVLVDEWFYKFGVPGRIHSDQGRNFESALIRQLCEFYQATGESPYFFMFGQEPRLPVDFLLGRVTEPCAGSVHNWIVEHQMRLQVAFEGARERLKAAADYRKSQHDQHVRDLPLKEGQLVYLRDHSVRGRHKIQDLWSPIVYQVVRAPKEGGVVYTIAPVEDLDKVRCVHRSLLKNRIRRESMQVDQLTGPVSGPGVSPLEDEMDYVDLLVLVPEIPQPAQVLAPEGLGHLVPFDPTNELLLGSRGHSNPLTVEPEVSLDLLSGSMGDGPVATRRTGRTTAGQHSNMHRLPRTDLGAKGREAGSIPF